MAYVVTSAEPYGVEFLVIVTVAVALSDIAAYATGSALRSRKLMPRVDRPDLGRGARQPGRGGGRGRLAGGVAVPPDWSVAAVCAGWW